MEKRLSITNLSLCLNDQVLLSGISCSLSSDTNLIIIGESGSGKSLLSKLMIGHLPKGAQVAGEILYRGKNLLKLSSQELRVLRGQEIAYMVQNPMSMFNPFKRIKSHFIETLRSHRDLSKSDCLNLALAMMKELRLGHGEKVLKSYPFELSGGMLQRVMLAILLCLDPEVIILDEPTSALDAYNRENILRILKELKNKGKQLILVTHDYELARDLGGNLLVMHQGMMVEYGSVDQVLDNPVHAYTQSLVLSDPYERLVTND